MGRKHRSGISERKIIILPDSEGPKRKPDFEHKGFRKCSVLEQRPSAWKKMLWNREAGSCSSECRDELET